MKINVDKSLRVLKCRIKKKKVMTSPLPLAAAEKSTLKLFSSQLSSRDAEIYIIYDMSAMM
jgi:hypothetical protein